MKVKVRKFNPSKSYYAVKTDKGYLYQNNTLAILFTDNINNARKFSKSEAIAYKQSIADDLFEFYNIQWMEFSKI